MYQNASNLVYLNEQINNFKKELSDLMEISKQKDDKLDDCLNELTSLKKELSLVSDVTDKTKDYLFE